MGKKRIRKRTRPLKPPSPPPKCVRVGTKLTKRDKVFAAHYLLHLNASEAYRQARPHYTGKNAGKLGMDLLRKELVAEHIQRLMTDRSKKTGINAEFVLRELQRIASSDLREMFDSSGALLPVQQWSDAAGTFVSAIETKEEIGGEGQVAVYTRKLKIWDKLKALELLGKHLRLFADVLVLDENLAAAVKAGNRRASASAAVKEG